MEFGILTAQKTVFDAGVDCGLPLSQSSFRHDQQIVIAYVKCFHAEVTALVALDISVFSITAVKDNHHDVFYLVADQADEFVQVALFALGQKIDRVLHTHKISKKYPEIHTRCAELIFIRIFVLRFLKTGFVV